MHSEVYTELLCAKVLIYRNGGIHTCIAHLFLGETNEKTLLGGGDEHITPAGVFCCFCFPGLQHHLEKKCQETVPNCVRMCKRLAFLPVSPCCALNVP